MKDISQNYIVIQGWMRTKLDLKGNELLVYSIIHGFSQAEDNVFTGSVSYIMNWTGASRRTVFNTLASLVDKGLVIKKEREFNGMQMPIYYTNKDIIPNAENASPLIPQYVPSAKFAPPVQIEHGPVQNMHDGSAEIAPNNIKDKNNNKSIDYKKVVDYYNSHCSGLRKLQKLTPKRESLIRSALKLWGDKIYEAMDRAQKSSFLCGKVNGFKAGFDFVFSSEKMTKILEGDYDDRNKPASSAYERNTDMRSDWDEGFN